MAAWEAESAHIFQLAAELNRTLLTLSSRSPAQATGEPGVSNIAAALRALQATLAVRLPSLERPSIAGATTGRHSANRNTPISI